MRNALVLTLLVANLVCAAAARAQDQPSADSVRNEFMQSCDAWFWRCDCVAKDLYPAAVREARESQRAAKLTKLRTGCARNSWRAVGNWRRVLTEEQFRRLGFTPPADGSAPAASPCEVAEKVETASLEKVTTIADASALWMIVAPQTACRNEAGIRQRASAHCDAKTTNCDCYAREYTKFWMTHAEGFSSKDDVFARTTALSACGR